VLLSIGGVERRKNTLNILRAFQNLHADMPDLHLLIAGGASLLDHHAQRTAFNAALADTAFSDRVHLVGVIADQDMPALYRLADALVFPSLEEGFGLCALESLASLRPTIVSARAPFTEHFLPEEVLFTDPESPAAIAASMRLALAPEYAHYVRQNGRNVAGRFRWDKVALAHLPLYQSCATQELLHA
jgi:glycosyltransferase involved in cell wall biosynthesis